MHLEGMGTFMFTQRGTNTAIRVPKPSSTSLLARTVTTPCKTKPFLDLDEGYNHVTEKQILSRTWRGQMATAEEWN